MPRFWNELWEKEQKFFESAKGEFRHGTSFVAVSSIAEQYYCEYKLENEFALARSPPKPRTRAPPSTTSSSPWRR